MRPKATIMTTKATKTRTIMTTKATKTIKNSNENNNNCGSEKD